MSSSCSDSDSGGRKRHKKHKKKEKKGKKHKKEKKRKEKKSHKKRIRHASSSSSGSGSDRDEWIEKGKPTKPAAVPERDDWMNSLLIPTYSKEVKRDEKKPPVERYDPKTSVRELNPHWRNGGSGLPSFKRPADDEDEYGSNRREKTEIRKDLSRSGGWRKPSDNKDTARQENVINKDVKKLDQESEDGVLLNDQQLNDLGAKIVKAEIMGNIELAKSLKDKLEKAKEYRNQIQNQNSTQKRRNETQEEDDVQFTVCKSTTESIRRNKQQRRSQNNLPPNDLADKFRSERSENDNMDAEFFKVSTKLDREGSNLENIFDHGRASSSSSGQTNEEKAVRDMNRLSKAQADCARCINSSTFLQDNIISMGKNIFLAVPSWKALQPKHCLIMPVAHYPALTHMDEDVHEELITTCKALKRMFASHKQEVVFFETVRYINRNPHTYIQCVPADNYEMAPFYFKKAILESETEWAMNKKLHNLQGLEIRRVVPKGLPYFLVNFNMENGFAHVIEDQESFPVTFASETIAGILGLDTRDWRNPGKEHNPKQRVREFQLWWKEYDNLTKI
ncbi:CWF19-like protein 2 [Toxorhynchites rutilus septentrionalis]|uniref:CWF19-like protein 2 n=1 Tax=Toxorhynchites rutilus septentrionalis TaxID=329112 RepID=UPI00247ABA2E|nr:CWF19-like protein 2 [Toxorhynchites rutilus septentrionalis]